ncbi:MAG: 3-phosphoshikimate 1-carboxyvinyltransferase [Desulfovibrionaceae bacterium]
MSVRAVTAPPSKSLSHRAILAASLAVGQSHLTGVLEAKDTERTIAIMNAVGARIERTAPGAYTVTGNVGLCQGGPIGSPVDIDVHESGTTCRLIIPILAAGNGDFYLHGAPRMHERPVAQLVETLRAKNVSIEYKGKEGCPPLLIQAAGLPGGLTAISMEESSQYLSGLLLASPVTRQPMIVDVVGDKAVSWPYVALTLQTLADFDMPFSVETLGDDGAWTQADWRAMTEVVPGRTRFRVRSGMYMPHDLRVEGDWSNASYFLIAGAVGPDPVRVEGLKADSLQGDRAICAILERMGARITVDNGAIEAAPPTDGTLRGIDVDMSHCPDLVPGVAVAAALAQGPTVIRGVAHLRIKECDRLEVPAMELRKAGATVEVLDDGLRITPGAVPTGTALALGTHGDHRIAMSLSILERAGATVTFDDPSVVTKSFPGFFEQWKAMV